jgi:hypothetical protein
MAGEEAGVAIGQRVRRIALRAGMGGLILAILGGLLPLESAPTTVAAKPRHDRAERQGTAVEARDARRGVDAEIVGGTPVKPGTLAFATAIWVESGSFEYFCTGSLITPRHVLTAAHCVESGDDPDGDDDLFAPAQFTAAIGRTNVSTVPAANLFGVEAVFQHPNWDPTVIKNDVAVLRLSRDVPAKIARPIAVVGSGDTRFDAPGQGATGAGWGLTSGGGSASATLLKMTTSVISDTTCDPQFNIDVDDASVICGQVPAKAACNGDSGGPLFVVPTASQAARESKGGERAKQVADEGKKGKKKKPKKKAKPPVLIGVASFAIIGCPPGTPSGYAQVSAPIVRDFVAGVIAD